MKFIDFLRKCTSCINEIKRLQHQSKNKRKKTNWQMRSGNELVYHLFIKRRGKKNDIS